MSGIQSKIQSLLVWAGNFHSSLREGVEIYQDPITSLSFRATRDIPSGTTLVTCSYHITLSYLNAIEAGPCFGNHGSVPFPLGFMTELKTDGFHIIGNFFLIQQYLMGESSFWYPYIQLLPQPDQPEALGIPVWWPKEDQKYLIGTNAEPAVKQRKALWEMEWNKGVSLLRDQLENWECYTYTLYQWAATIFGTRSFRASLTITEELIRGQSSEDMAPLLEHIKRDRFSILLPVLDIGNHNGYNQVKWTPNPVEAVFGLTSHTVVSRGSQIYNYYGNKTNSELLVGYGFIIPEPWDAVNLRVTPGPEDLYLRRAQKSHEFGQPGE